MAQRRTGRTRELSGRSGGSGAADHAPSTGNRQPLNPLDDSVTIFRRAVDASSPSAALDAWLNGARTLFSTRGEPLDPHWLTRNDRPIHLLAVGKAAWTMARTAAPRCGEPLASCTVIAPEQHARRPLPDVGVRVELFGAEHPVPGPLGLHATEHAIRRLRTLPPGHRLLVLLSGGTSSMLCRPVPPLELDDLAELSRLLLRGGLSIHEMNTVRKAVSSVKAGQLLAQVPHGVEQLDLIVSDVPGDDPAVIGSGPTTPGERSPDSALKVLDRTGLLPRVPIAIRRVLEQHAALESVNPTAYHTPIRPSHQQAILTSSRLLAACAADTARSLGYLTHPVPDAWDGPCQGLADRIVEEAMSTAWPSEIPDVRVHHGECTLSVTGDRPGGRNQHLALLAGHELWEASGGEGSSSGRRRFVLLSAGSDGRDGFTDAAGAVIRSDTFTRAERLGADPTSALRAFDSHGFFRQVGGLVTTGPTGNNLMDLQILIRIPDQWPSHGS